jgi:transmembrane sensor
MSYRENLVERYYNGTATKAERLELLKILEVEGRPHEDELFQQLMIELEREKSISEEDRELAVSLYFKRTDKKPDNVIPISRSRSIFRWSVAAAIAAALGLTWYNYGFKETDTEQIAFNETPADSVITIRTVRGSKFVVLPDASTVLLNENSTLTYVRRYGYDTREVTLTGEGYFDVAHNPFTPFKVRTGKLVTTVLGTAFNIKVVKDPAGGDKFTVTVSRGKVAVDDDRQSYGTLKPNEQISVNTDSHMAVRNNVKADQFLIINNLAFEDAVEMIAMKFNVKITLENQALRKCRITSAFLEEPKLEKVLTVITALANATYAMNDGNVTIHGGGECN